MILSGPQFEVQTCKECGSEDIHWYATNQNRSDVQQGRLRTSDVECLFILGCGECSETLKVVSADQVAAAMTQGKDKS